MSQAKRHHFVPKFLLRPWLYETAKGDKVLRGFFWDERRNQLRAKERGLDSFCNQVDLLTLKDHPDGRDALERIFFGEIDDSGAKVRDRLVSGDLADLSAEERSAFARLILSVEARRPVNVEKLTVEGAATFRQGLDADPEILAEFRKLEINELPSQYFERSRNQNLEDHALTIIQRLVDNPRVGGALINANWLVRRIGDYEGTLVIADRPVIRIGGFDHPGCVWALPLSPKHILFAANHEENHERLMRVTDQRICKLLNSNSAEQAEKFVFSENERDRVWLERRLKPRG